MTKLISYWDDTLKKYVEVSTTDPLPTTAIGGGSGGAEEVEITSANGAAKTGLANADALPGTDVGLLTNDRNYAYNGTSWDRVRVSTHAIQPNSTPGLIVNSRLLAQENSNTGSNTIPLIAYAAISDNTTVLDNLLQTNARGSIFNGSGFDRTRSVTGASDAYNGVGITAMGELAYNGTTWDRVRNNMEGTLLASAARTATISSANQTNHNSKGVIIYLNVTANPGGAETLKVSLRYIDPVSGAESLDIASNTTVAATNGLYTLQIYPGTLDTTDSTANNATYSMMLPRTWKATVTPSAAGSFTYSLGYSLIV